MRPLEAGEQAGQPRFGKVLRKPDPHPSFKRGQSAQRRAGLVVEVEDAAGIADKDLASFCKCEAPSLFADQRLTDLIFQLPQLQADG